MKQQFTGFGIVNLEWAGKEILASLKEHRIWCLDLGAMRLGGRGFVAECGAGAEKLAKVRQRVKDDERKGRGFHYILHNSKLAKL